jgi:hypothetical protein
LNTIRMGNADFETLLGLRNSSTRHPKHPVSLPLMNS